MQIFVHRKELILKVLDPYLGIGGWMDVSYHYKSFVSM